MNLLDYVKVVNKGTKIPIQLNMKNKGNCSPRGHEVKDDLVRKLIQKTYYILQNEIYKKNLNKTDFYKKIKLFILSFCERIDILLL